MQTTTPIEVTAEVKQYTLVGDDIYVKRYTNENIPTWYSDMVSTIIAGDNTIADQSAAIAYLESLAPGYSISITNLQNKDLQIDTVLDSLVTTTGDHTAAIANLDITKVDSTSAAAVALDTIGAYFADGSAAAYFNSYISTYASNIAANASSISTLSASLGSTNVRIDDIDTILITTTGWAASASKLITASDGSITGWSFADGSNINSEFSIYADSFKVVNPSTGDPLIEFNTLTSKIETTGTFITYTDDGLFYSKLDGGGIAFYQTGSTAPYKYLKNIQTGTAAPTGVPVQLVGFFGSVPDIMVSTNSLATYDPAHPDKTQIQNIGYTNLNGSVDTGLWEFTPTVELALSASNITVGSIPAKQSVDYTELAYGTAVTNYSVSTLSPTLTTKIDITSGKMALDYYKTYAGSSVLIPITFTVTLQYSLDGSTWLNGTNYGTQWNIGTSNTSVHHEISISGLTTGVIAAAQYYYRFKFESVGTTALTNLVYNWNEPSTCYLSTTTCATYYTTTGTTVLQNGYINYVAVGR